MYQSFDAAAAWVRELLFHHRKIAEYLRRTVDGKNGNYIAFFPSYQFMEDVLEEFEKRSSGVELVIQSQFMSENQREEFLEMFEEERDHPMLGFV